MPTRLRRVCWSDPGISRRRAGRGWSYLDTAGRPVRDQATLERIRGLVIPPAWSDVWICPLPNGHIQAVGLDARGRRQYLYHTKWRQRRDLAKFDRMLGFARVLPDLRHAVAHLLADGEGLGRDRVLAASVRLLDLGFFRIGGETYARQNSSFGLATILKSQVRLGGNSSLLFDYPAKSGRRRIQSIVDPEVFEIVAALKARRGGGPELLAYRENRLWRDVRSSDINDFIKESTDGDFTAKDFRTWSATVLAAVGLAVSTAAQSQTARKRAVVRVVKEVSHYLGNTPAVARRSYIDPRIIDLYASGRTIDPELTLSPPTEGHEGPAALILREAIEAAVLDLLDPEPPGAQALRRSRAS